MNWTHINRIAWKDMRRMGALWLCLVGFWILCAVVSTWQWAGGNFASPFPRYEALALFVPFIVVIHALAWAGVAFSSEHEDNTFGFLRSLPLDAKNVFYGKLAYGLTSTLSLGVVLLLIAMLSRWFIGASGVSIESMVIADDPAQQLRALGWLLAASIPLTLAIGMFWSLKTKSLLALMLGAGTSIVIVTLVCAGVSTLSPRHVMTMRNWGAIYATLVALAGVVFLVDRRVVEAWLPNRAASPLLHRATIEVAQPPANFTGRFGRLMWMQLKHGLLRTLLIGLAGSCLAVFGLSATGPLPLFAIGLLGIFVFRSEHQSKRFRFLSQVGVRPFSYWLSRVLLPAFAAFLIAAIGSQSLQELVYMSRGSYMSYDSGEYGIWMAFAMFGCIGTFCIAQLASIAFSSTIVAIAVTLVCSIAAWTWLYVCAILYIPVGFGEEYFTHQFPLSLFLSGGFLIALSLLASYLRVSRWFQETSSWKQWVIPALPIGTLVIGLPILLGLWRVYSIPSAELPSAFATFDAHIAETEGTRAYRKVFLDLPNMPNADYSMRNNLTSMPIQKWLGVHPDFVEELTEVIKVGGPIPEENRMRVYSPIQFGRQNHGVHQVMMAATCLLRFARNEVIKNNLDAALEHYKSALTMASHLNDGKSNPGTQAHAFEIERAVYDELTNWAMAKENTAENVQAAAVYLYERRDDVPPKVNALLAYYHQLDEALADGVSLQTDNYEKTNRAATISALMPWEKTRARRYMKLAFSREHDRTHGVYDVSRDEALRQEAMYAATTLGGEHMLVAGSNVQYPYQEKRRRSAIAQLALIAHKLDTGEYPDSLMAVRLDGKPLSAEFGSFTFVKSKAELASAPCLTFDAETILLPQDDFSLWTEDQFDERLGLSAPAQVQYESGMSGYGYYGDAGMGNFAAPMFELLSTFWDETTGKNAAEQLMLKELRHMLEAGSKEQRLQLISSMEGWVPVEIFTAELLNNLDGQDVEVAGAAARTLERLLLEYDEDQPTLEYIDSAVLDRASASTNSNKVAYRLPIRNPDNGNYYEFISPELAGEYVDPDPDQDEPDAKPFWQCIRKFRGAEGKLADLDSDDQFIKQAFPNLRRINGMLLGVLIEYAVEEAEQEPADDDATD